MSESCSLVVDLDSLALKHGTDKASTGNRYTEAYEFMFAGLRDKLVRLLEIGVYRGASLETWAEYFPQGQVTGVDIDLSCWQLATDRIRVCIGSQADEKFLQEVGVFHGPFDVIIDDGSHRSEDQLASLYALWPHLKDGGFYVIEDLACNFLPSVYGPNAGRGNPQSTIEWLKRVQDVLHAHSGHGGLVGDEVTETICSMYLHPMMAFLRKGVKHIWESPVDLREQWEAPAQLSPTRKQLISGFTPLPGVTHRSSEEYRALGQRFLKVPVLKMVAHPELEDLWAWKRFKGTPLPERLKGDNKDTFEYMCFQFQKSHIIRDAFKETDAEVLAWVDFGIFHLDDVQQQDLVDFYERLVPRDRIVMPSCYRIGSREMDLDYPYWFCVGGCFVMPRALASWFADAVEQEMTLLVAETGKMTWEVNCWARIAMRYPEKFEFYPAGHDRSMFTNYPGRARG